MHACPLPCSCPIWKLHHWVLPFTCRALWQVYALEKVLEVTSTISVAAAPKPRARLVELTGVNELPQVHRLMAI